MRKLAILGVTLWVASASAYSGPPSYKVDSATICPMHDHQAMMAHSAAVSIQDDGQGDSQPAPHRISPGDGCSSVNPKAKPGTELNGIKKNTVGCTCVKKCVNGQTVEDLSKDKKGVYVCRNASHKDRCFCPDPCKS